VEVRVITPERIRKILLCAQHFRWKIHFSDRRHKQKYCLEYIKMPFQVKKLIFWKGVQVGTLSYNLILATLAKPVGQHCI